MGKMPLLWWGSEDSHLIRIKPQDFQAQRNLGHSINIHAFDFLLQAMKGHTLS